MHERLLVTGCTGLLGSNLCFLLKNRFDIVGLSRGKFKMSGVSYASGDITDSSFIKAFLKEQKFDAVVHCAALTNVDQCEREPDLAMLMNCDSAVNMAEAASLANSRFVFISTDAVFDGNKNGSYTENDTVNPINVYGESKARAEERLVMLDNTVVVRTNMYGFNYSKKNSLSEWVTESLRAENDISMFEDVRFSALLVNDLCDAIGRLALSDNSGILHVASSDSMSKYAFGQFLKEALDLPGHINAVSVDDFDFIARRSKNMSLDSTKAAELLDKSMPSMREGIVRYADLEKRDYRLALRGYQ